VSYACLQAKKLNVIRSASSLYAPHQKGQVISDINKARDDEAAIASAGPLANHLHLTPKSKQITMPVPHHWMVCRPNGLRDAQPTVSKHWRL